MLTHIQASHAGSRKVGNVRRKNSAWLPLKVGHMGGAKIHRNGNESTFRQTSMHHAGASYNMQRFNQTTHTSFMHIRVNRPPTSFSCLQQTSIHQYPPCRSRSVAETWPWSMRESVWWWRENSGQKERRRIYMETLPKPSPIIYQIVVGLITNNGE